MVVDVLSALGNHLINKFVEHIPHCFGVALCQRCPTL